MSITLGLDLGSNSVGWALVDSDSQKLIAMGSRIFPEGVDNFDTSKEIPRNEARRIARGMRRQVRRRAQRKRQLRDTLIAIGLFPDHPDEQRQLGELDPYALRARALDEKLTLYEFGRVLLHLNRRRGFLSNRKKDRKDSEVKGMLAEISELANDIKTTDARTLGEYLHQKSEIFDHADRQENDHIRSRHTLRQMLMDEFDAIWQVQAKHHSDVLTDQLRYGSFGQQKQPHKPRQRPKGESLLETFGVEGMVFFQRPMYWPRSVVGICELELKQKRCPRADRRAQRFRLHQEINNIRYIDPDTHDEKALSDEQRTLLLDKFATKKEMTFEQIKKALGFLDAVQFNLEKGKRPKLLGMVSDAMLAAKSAVGPAWHKLPEDDKDAIVHLLATSTDDDETHETLVRQFSLTAEQADAALSVELPAGYVNLSLKAIEKLLPFLAKGMRLMANDETDSAMHAAGYMRRDELTRRILDTLPDPAKSRDARIGDIPNPVVKRAIVELRKVVNSIIRKHDKPDAIHVEMARQVRQGPKARSDYNKRIRDIEAERDTAANEIRNTDGVRVSRDSILQYRLWLQQERTCIYCGNKISQVQLFGGEIDVDHILPYSRTLDDSQANKVVCHRKCNADKSNRTPYEWLADSDPERFEEIVQRALSLVRKNLLSYRKYQRFTLKELKLDDFVARQLNTTSYIATATSEYLRCLFGEDHKVLGLKGELTAELRRQWGLNDVLRNDGLDLKSRDDHRHHAIDAIIVAMTDRPRLNQLSRIRKSGGVLKTGEALEFPWESFRDDVVTAVNKINVSHRSQRKVAGALHEETLYGPTAEKNVYVVRKSLESLSPNEIEKIRDLGIRKIVKARLRECGIEIGRGKKADASKWREAMSGIAMPSGVPIKRVRVLRNDQTVKPIREKKAKTLNDPDRVAYIKPGSTHHLTLFEWQHNGKTKYDAMFVTQLEAINRVKNKQPIIQRIPPKDHPDIPSNAKFLFSLSRGEMVLANRKGERKLLTLKTAISTNKRLVFAEHTDARKSSDVQKIAFSPKDYDKLRKVTVDPLGRIRWAND